MKKYPIIRDKSKLYLTEAKDFISFRAIIEILCMFCSGERDKYNRTNISILLDNKMHDNPNDELIDWLFNSGFFVEYKNENSSEVRISHDIIEYFENFSIKSTEEDCIYDILYYGEPIKDYRFYNIDIGIRTILDRLNNTDYIYQTITE